MPYGEESQPLMTFITEWGYFIHLRMLLGHLVSGDTYSCRYDEIIKTVACKVKVVNDTLLFNKTKKRPTTTLWNICRHEKKMESSSTGINFNLART